MELYLALHRSSLAVFAVMDSKEFINHIVKSSSLPLGFARWDALPTERYKRYLGYDVLVHREWAMRIHWHLFDQIDFIDYEVQTSRGHYIRRRPVLMHNPGSPSIVLAEEVSRKFHEFIENVWEVIFSDHSSKSRSSLDYALWRLRLCNSDEFMPVFVKIASQSYYHNAVFKAAKEIMPSRTEELNRVYKNAIACRRMR